VVERIESYGLLGDTRTAALVSERGSIDWLCVPRFDGEPIFGALIDNDRGGHWSISMRDARVVERDYTDNAASIRTRWQGREGALTVHEGLISDVSSSLRARMTLVRHVRCVAGEAVVDVEYDPRLGLPGAAPHRVRRDGASVVCSWKATAVALGCDRAIDIRPGARTTLTLRNGESVAFLLGLGYREPLVHVPASTGHALLEQDDRWWRDWAGRCEVEGQHAAKIIRSLLTLRLLTYAPSGAPVAAPTTSLPTPPGSDQTWDYRYSWPRDACIGIGAFLAFGLHDEPRAFLEWFVHASRTTSPRLEVLYNLDGRPLRHERTVAGVSGFDDGRPVRIGNAAASQHQLDVYGWVLDAAWLMHRAGERLSRTHWRALRRFADEIAKSWREPDNGIWEERDAPKQFVHSKLMAWTGLDRAMRLADEYPAERRAQRWRKERERLGDVIHRRGFDQKANAYTRLLDDDALDASVLILPVLDFDVDASRINGTIDAIKTGLGAGGALLYRYERPEKPASTAFLPCSFWLVQALARAGRVEEAEVAFDELCAMSTPLGLYAEQMDPESRSMAGNFPQAFTHATFLQAAAALSEARGTSRGSHRRTRVRLEQPEGSAHRN
jgi:GH15 family glucan-1,4-alpha-glucosidase